MPIHNERSFVFKSRNGSESCFCMVWCGVVAQGLAVRCEVNFSTTASLELSGRGQRSGDAARGCLPTRSGNSFPLFDSRRLLSASGLRTAKAAQGRHYNGETGYEESGHFGKGVLGQLKYKRKHWSCFLRVALWEGLLRVFRKVFPPQEQRSVQRVVQPGKLPGWTTDSHHFVDRLCVNRLGQGVANSFELGVRVRTDGRDRGQTDDNDQSQHDCVLNCGRAVFRFQEVLYTVDEVFH